MYVGRQDGRKQEASVRFGYEGIQRQHTKEQALTATKVEIENEVKGALDNEIKTDEINQQRRNKNTETQCSYSLFAAHTALCTLISLS